MPAGDRRARSLSAVAPRPRGRLRLFAAFRTTEHKRRTSANGLHGPLPTAGGGGRSSRERLQPPARGRRQPRRRRGQRRPQRRRRRRGSPLVVHWCSCGVLLVLSRVGYGVLWGPQSCPMGSPLGSYGIPVKFHLMSLLIPHGFSRFLYPGCRARPFHPTPHPPPPHPLHRSHPISAQAQMVTGGRMS
eukprot:6900032-Pyramimonas_sp.AAC.1